MNISVVLANYNGGAYLDDAIESVLAQDFKQFEFIIVDDRSTDGSRRRIARWERRDSRIAVFHHDVNRGQASGFNTGVRVASGDAICFMDSDDIWLPSKLSFVVEAFARHPDASLLQHSLFLIRNGNKTTERSVPALISGDVYAWSRANPKRLPQFVSTTGLSIPRAICRAIFPIPEAFRLCADGFMTRTAMCHGMVYHFPTVLGYYRIHEKNGVAENKAWDTKNYIAGLLVPELNGYYGRAGFDLRFSA